MAWYTDRVGAYPRPVDEPETELAVRCAECGRKVDEPTAEREGWGYWSDGLGELQPYCPECAEREFGRGDDLTN